MAKPTKRRGGKRRTEAPDDQAEKRVVTAQHNLKITPDRQKQHIATLEGYDGKIAHLVGQRRKAIQQMKAEGFNTDSLRDLIKMKKADPLVQRDYYEQFSLGLRHIGTEFQIKVHDAIYGDPVEQATAEGTNAAAAGRSPECRWPEGSPEHEAYLAAYMDKQSKMVPGADAIGDKEREEAVKAGRQDRTAKRKPDFVE